MEIPEDKENYRELVEKDRIYKFLDLIMNLMKYVGEFVEPNPFQRSEKCFQKLEGKRVGENW